MMGFISIIFGENWTENKGIRTSRIENLHPIFAKWAIHALLTEERKDIRIRSVYFTHTLIEASNSVIKVLI